MTQDVLYTTFWSQMTRVPPPEVGWLNEEQARMQFEQGDLQVVDAAHRDADSLPWPRWVIGIGTSGRVRVRFFDEHTTLWRLVDWDNIDGRLWRWITYDYTYSSTGKQWSEKDSILTEKASVQTDGTGYVVTVDKSTKPGRRLKTDFADRASGAYWLDYPKFGDWVGLSSPGPSAYEIAGRSAPAPTQ